MAVDRWRCLAWVAIGRFSSQFQLLVRLIQKFFCLLCMAGHVPFIGFLGVDNSLPGLPAEPLCGSKIGMTGTRDVSFGPLGNGCNSDDEQQSSDGSYNSVFHHNILLTPETLQEFRSFRAKAGRCFSPTATPN